jgi:hypothetical protein
VIALHVLRWTFIVGLLAFVGLLVWLVVNAAEGAAICEEELGGTWTRIGCIVGDFQIIEDPTSASSETS